MLESPEVHACRRSTSEEATAAFYARLRRRAAWHASIARSLAPTGRIRVVPVPDVETARAAIEAFRSAYPEVRAGVAK